jgi:hypothetical protein
MFLYLSRKDFADLESKLNKAVKTGIVKSFSPTGDTSGVITSHDVVVEFSYDPTGERLNIAVGKRLSLAAKVAPQQVIEAHILELIHNLEPDVKPVPKSVTVK